MFIKELRIPFLFLLLFSASAAFSQQSSVLTKNQSINYVLGDESYVNTFGILPARSTNEKLRIKTHLQYVESLLRSKKQAGLSEALFTKRNAIIEHLHNYIVKEQFPVNYDYKNERKPCFIDKNGNICAVGYLIEQTSGRKLSEEINEKYKYSYIHEMNDDDLSEWISNSGLTARECAMIQPAYGEPEYDDSGQRLNVTYAVSSSFLTGANLTFSALNVISIASKERSFSRAIIGVISGLAQLTLGVLNVQGTSHGYEYTSTESRRMVSMMNISIGSATTILSLINLFSSDKPESSGGKSLYSRFRK